MNACHDEAELLALVGRIRAGTAPADRLVDVLREDAPLHAGRSTGATGRVRGWVLASFAELGLPERALPFVLEELRSGIEPYPVAGAARAVRGGRADLDAADALVSSFGNLRFRDEPVSFTSLSPTWPTPDATSALREILATALWLDRSVPERWRQVRTESPPLEPAVRDLLDRAAQRAPDSPCCAADHHPAGPQHDSERGGSLATLAHLVLEDHDGRRRALGDLTLGAPTVLTFFYTRCENPNKCSLTIAKLAELQRWLADRDHDRRVRILALTYDPEYDLPSRLRRYVRARGLRLDAATTVGRLPHEHAVLRDHLQLRVGRGGATVNRHAVEVFTIAPDGGVAAVQERRDWDVAEVGASALALPRWSDVARAGLL